MSKRPTHQLSGRVSYVLAETFSPPLQTWASTVAKGCAYGAALAGVLIVKELFDAVASLMIERGRSSHRGLWSRYAMRRASHSLLGPRSTTVLVVRITDSAGQVFPVRFEGPLASGQVTVGDNVVVRLRSVAGVNIVTDGHNYTTGEEIRFIR